MGLDMYLTKHIFVGAKYEHLNINGKIELKQGNEPIQVQLEKVSEIIEEVAYWRKANHIHKWFVDNVQDGEDDCKSYYVSFEKLMQLKLICQEILNQSTEAEKHAKSRELLPTREGFFFGGTEYDEYYFEDLKNTIKMLSELEEDGDYYYQSSW